MFVHTREAATGVLRPGLAALGVAALMLGMMPTNAPAEATEPGAGAVLLTNRTTDAGPALPLDHETAGPIALVSTLDLAPDGAFVTTDGTPPLSETIARHLRAGGHRLSFHDLGVALPSAPSSSGAEAPQTIPAELLSVEPATARQDSANPANQGTEPAPERIPGAVVQRVNADGMIVGEETLASASAAVHPEEAVTLATSVTVPSDGSYTFALEGEGRLTVDRVVGAPTVEATAGDVITLRAERDAAPRVAPDESEPGVAEAPQPITLAITWHPESAYALPSVAALADSVRDASAVVVVIEGALPIDHTQLVTALAAANPRTIVVLDAFADPQLGFWVAAAAAVLHAPTGNADAATVLDGTAEPSVLEAPIIRPAFMDEGGVLVVAEELFAAGHGLSYAAPPEEEAAVEEASVGADEEVRTTPARGEHGRVAMPRPGLILTVSQGEIVLGMPERLADRIRLSGALPAVTVADHRGGATTGWTVSAHVSDLSGTGGTLTPSELGWSPRLLTSTGGVVPGPAVPGRLSGGPGLSGTVILGSGEATTEGPVSLGADLVLETGLATPPGTYRGAITVTLFPEE